MPKNKKGSFKLSDYQRYTRVFGLLVVVAVVVAGWLWWSKVYESPQNVFWGMVSSNLSTSSFTKQVSETSSSTDLNQDVEVSLGTSDTAHAFSTVTQSGSTVKTEEINTPSADYVRYTSIATNQKSTSGKPLNFQSILNVWGSTTSAESPDGSQLFSQALLGIFPIGNLTAAQRGSLIQLIKGSNVYSVDFATVKRQTFNGRQQYIYGVKVQPFAYIELLQAFSKDVGLTGLNGVNPESYANDPAIEFTVSVDMLSRNLTAIVYPDETQVEEYGGYGLARPAVTIPPKTISLTDLQDRLQTINQ